MVMETIKKIDFCFSKKKIIEMNKNNSVVSKKIIKFIEYQKFLCSENSPRERKGYC